MAKFLGDSGWTAAESWRVIRSVRAEPPARFTRVLKGERRVVFHAALEQAQQQFSAASGIGFESRPLNLFYGLAQAGRALAAASSDLYPKHAEPAHQSWESTSHGMEFAPTGTAADFWDQEVAVKPNRLETFSRASIALASPTDVKSVALGSLVAQFPEFTREWRGFTKWPRPVQTENAHISGESGYLELATYTGAGSAKDIADFASRYPALRGLSVRIGADGSPETRPNDWYSLEVPAERVEGGQYRKRPTGFGLYLGTRMAFPQAGHSTESLHPLMSWWLVLFGFSILARYHPKRWTEALSISSSKVASQIEFVLEVAPRIVPEMIARELWDSPWAD